jgi:hypothetical protein
MRVRIWPSRRAYDCAPRSSESTSQLVAIAKSSTGSAAVVRGGARIASPKMPLATALARRDATRRRISGPRM